MPVTIAPAPDDGSHAERPSGRAACAKQPSIARALTMKRCTNALRRSSVARKQNRSAFSKNLHGSTKMRRHVESVLVDDFRQRWKKLHSVRFYAYRKRNMSGSLFFLASLGIVLMIIELEGRLQSSVSETGLDVLRGLNLGLTAVCVALLMYYYHMHTRILYQTSARRDWTQLIVPFVELVCLLVGVIPPGISATLHITLMSVDDALGAPHDPELTDAVEAGCATSDHLSCCRAAHSAFFVRQVRAYAH
jgi:hypothetical protein